MKFSLPSIFLGIGVCALSLFQITLGHPPYGFFAASILAGSLVILGAIGGYEWAWCCVMVQAGGAWFFRDATLSAGILFLGVSVWYVGVSLLSVRGSPALMGVASGVLFFVLLLERIPSFSFIEWIYFVALLLGEISVMYFVGDFLKGRWFSPYA